jgi:hypothetical protein
MILYEFNTLTLEEKQATVWDKGLFNTQEFIKLLDFALIKFK